MQHSSGAALVYAIEASGLTSPPTVIADGKIHRWGPKKRYWYVLFADGLEAGAFGDWVTGLSNRWRARSDVKLTLKERTELNDRVRHATFARVAEERARHRATAELAAMRWLMANDDGICAHPYLASKCVRPFGLRVDAENRLLIRVHDESDLLCNLQVIQPDGVKRFLRGGRIKGCSHWIGGPASSVIVCEGWATGASIHAAIGRSVVVAFYAGNLVHVAVALRRRYPDISITIAADDDWRTPGNPGVTAATRAATAAGGLMCVPNFFGLPRGDKDTDFNDLQRLVSRSREALA
ncbi:MAG: toprim domain-containing protein [Gammaproteobacteria bacterium]|nr:toprim domain-containing protein [Gammaproteobacteria bacterium]MBU1441453.1 toprim domain-containing protein [Gammaproteobacteria bacterium]MBU2285558.1 toprim domain-containing protein [Gammaproteobacteria bacterium]MBU2407245.1 toprim domain-containing protein [Gammaproteobacteria bacterium]